MNKRDITPLISEMYNGIAPYTNKEQCAKIAASIAIKHIKFHVKAALKAASNKAKIINDPYAYTGNTGSEYPPDQVVDTKSILNAYPETNIV